MQEATFGRTDAILASALCMYLDDLPRPGAPEPIGRLLDQARAQSKDLLLSNPLILPLPGLPQDSGGSARFTGGIRAVLQDFADRGPLFSPLLVPVRLTLLVVPPAQGKDLDNIALTVLPIAHEVLRPHIEPHLLAPTFGDGQQ